MKNLKVIFLVALLFNVFNTFSQEKTNHLKFKGVEINGTLDSFTSKMKKKGFTLIGVQGGIAMLNGDFAGYRDCTLYVFTNNKGNVYSIGIYFPEVKNWMELYSDYIYIKELLVKKYGAPNFFKERFTASEPDDNRKFFEVQMNRCEYESNFLTENGIIDCKIVSIQMKCSVLLMFIDRINNQEDMNSLIEDL